VTGLSYYLVWSLSKGRKRGRKAERGRER